MSSSALRTSVRLSGHSTSTVDTLMAASFSKSRKEFSGQEASKVDGSSSGHGGSCTPRNDTTSRGRLSLRFRSGTRWAWCADRSGPARRCLRLRPLRALFGWRPHQPEHGRLRSDRPGEECLREELSLAPGRIRTAGLGGRPQRRIRAAGPGLGDRTGDAATRLARPSQSPRRPDDRSRLVGRRSGPTTGRASLLSGRRQPGPVVVTDRADGDRVGGGGGLGRRRRPLGVGTRDRPGTHVARGRRHPAGAQRRVGSHRPLDGRGAGRRRSPRGPGVAPSGGRRPGGNVRRADHPRHRSERSPRRSRPVGRLPLGRPRRPHDLCRRLVPGGRGRAGRRRRRTVIVGRGRGRRGLGHPGQAQGAVTPW